MTKGGARDYNIEYTDAEPAQQMGVFLLCTDVSSNDLWISFCLY